MLGMSAVVLVLTLAMMALHLASLTLVGRAHQDAMSTEHFINDIDRMLASLADAETGQRGFLLTGRDPYLEPYVRAQNEIPRVLDSLLAMVRDRPGTHAQVQELDRLAQAKFAELGETITLARAGDHERALAILNSDRGKRILDEIREGAATVKSSEMARAARFYATAERFSWFSFAASGLATASIIVAVLMLLATAHRVQKRQDLRIVDLQNFAGRVAHDILSPLATVSLGIDIARRHIEKEEKAGEKEEKAVRALDRAAATLGRVSTLVEGLLTFAKAGQRPEQGAEADVGSVLRDVVSTTQDVARARGVTIELEASCPAKVGCSTGVLTSMISNLLDNAVKYIGDASSKRVTVRATTNRGMTRVEVGDTGPGVPREIWATMFDPYVRAAPANAPGIGVGLATVRRLAEGHGGSAGFKPNLRAGSGSVFWFEVPNVPEAQPEAQADRTPAGGRHASWRTRWRAARHG